MERYARQRVSAGGLGVNVEFVKRLGKFTNRANWHFGKGVCKLYQQNYVIYGMVHKRGSTSKIRVDEKAAIQENILSQDLKVTED